LTCSLKRPTKHWMSSAARCRCRCRRQRGQGGRRCPHRRHRTDARPPARRPGPPHTTDGPTGTPGVRRMMDGVPPALHEGTVPERRGHEPPAALNSSSARRDSRVLGGVA
jgi:hypothetical protein